MCLFPIDLLLAFNFKVNEKGVKFLKYSGPQLSRQKKQSNGLAAKEKEIHGKRKNLTAKRKRLAAKEKNLAAIRKRLRAKEKTSQQKEYPHGKSERLTAKEITLRQTKKPHGKKNTLTGKLKDSRLKK